MTAPKNDNSLSAKIDSTTDLTAAHEPTGTTGGDTPPASDLPNVPGFVVLGELARGGMGVVFTAHDPVFDREVAIKVMHPGQDAGRFVVESKVTAQLPHPGVPPVYTLGVLPDARPFLAMKLVEGRTLRAELKESEEPDLPRLLGVFEQICQTVGFAHSKGIIHRDLKPANVMVGAFGEVLVMDWGLAKQVGANEEPLAPRASEADETQVGQIKGTPAYMAPEQARGEPVDARADVFALGGILGTILTGKAPFGGTTVAETIREAAAGKLGKVFARLEECEADAELIAVAKRCLAAKAVGRFADGRAVATAVSAYRASVEERLRTAERERAAAEAKTIEQRKRRKVQLALAATIGLFLLAGGVFAVWTERNAAARAIKEEQQAGEKREREGRNRDAVGSYLDRCEPALRAGDRETATAMFDEVEKRWRDGGAEELSPRIERCRVGVGLLTELDATDTFRWTSRRGKLPERSEVAQRWAKTFAGFGFVPGVTPPGELARRVNESLVRERLLAALDAWLVAEPAAVLADALRAADPDNYRDAMRAAVAAKDRKRVAELIGQDATLGQPPRFTVALGTLREAPLERRRVLLGRAAQKYPSDLTLLMLLSEVSQTDKEGAAHAVRWSQAAVSAHPRNHSTWLRLGNALHLSGDLVGAIAAFRQVIALDPNHPYAHYNLGTVLSNAGDPAGAAAAFRAAIKLDPTYSPAHNNLGLALLKSGDTTGAIAAFREAVRLDEKNIVAQENLAGTLSDADDQDGAIAAYHDLLRVDPGNALAHHALGGLLYEKGDKVGALAEFRAAIKANPKYPYAHYNLGIVLADMGDRVGAIAEYRETIRLDPKYSDVHNNLAGVLRANGDRAGAKAEYREAGRLDPKNAAAHYNLGVMLSEDGDEDGAIAAYREALRANPKQASSRFNLGLCLHDRGDLDGAAHSLREAVRLAPKNPRYQPMLDLVLGELAKRGPNVAPPPREK